ncbi:hypothetical protein [Streptomyces sp. NPDC051286]
MKLPLGAIDDERPPRSGVIGLFGMGGGLLAHVLLCCERVDEG